MSDMYSILRIESPADEWTPTPWQKIGETDELYDEETRTTRESLKDLSRDLFVWDEGVSEWPDGALSIAGGTKYRADSLHEFAVEYTKVTPDSTVTIREEWTGEDGPSIETFVFANGAEMVDEGSTSAELPNNLPQLLANVRALYTDSKHNHGPFGCEACMLTEAARALVGALDPHPEGATQ